MTPGKTKSVAKRQRSAGANLAVGMGRALWATVSLAVCWILYLHLYRLMHAGSLWRDEISSLYVATSPTLRDLYFNQAYDSFPLLNVLLLRGWLAFAGFEAGLPTESEQYARMFGLLGGLFLLGSVLWVTVCIFKTQPIFSLGLFAASPVVIVWGDSLRAYALGSALSVLFFGALWKWLEAPSLRRLAIGVFLAVAMVWSLHGNAFFVLSTTIAGASLPLVQRDWKKLWAALLPGAVAATSLVLNLPVMKQMGDMREGLAQHISAAAILERWWIAWATPGPWLPFVWIASLVAMCALCCKAIVRERYIPSRSDASGLSQYCILTTLSSFVGFCGYLKVVDIPPAAWYFIPISAICAVAMDAGWRLLRQDQRLFASQIVLLGVLIVGTATTTLAALQERMTNVDALARFFEREATSKDLILFNPSHNVCTLLRHYKGPAVVQCSPPLVREDLTIQRSDVLLKATYQATDPMIPLYDQIRKTLSSGGRVWMAGDIFPVPLDQSPPRIDQGTKFTDRWQLGPYLYVWGAQTFHYLGTHAKAGNVIELPSVNPCSRLEKVDQVVVWDGWRFDATDGPRVLE